MTEHPGKTDLSGRSSSCRPLIRRGGGRQSRRKQPTQAAPSRWKLINRGRGLATSPPMSLP
jgi:hypothetical protein